MHENAVIVMGFSSCKDIESRKTLWGAVVIHKHIEHLKYEVTTITTIQRIHYNTNSNENPMINCCIKS